MTQVDNGAYIVALHPYSRQNFSKIKKSYCQGISFRLNVCVVLKKKRTDRPTFIIVSKNIEG